MLLGPLVVDRVIRQARYKHPQSYFEHLTEGKPVFEENVVSVRDLPFEFMMNALRLKDGFEQCEFEQRTGLAFDELGGQLQRACERGLIENAGSRWRASARGFDFLNDLVGEFLRRSLPQL